MQSPPVSSRSGKGGPNTPEGKMRSARNAVKHGLNSTQPVILEFETPEAWEAFRTPLVESLHPATAAERHLAEEIALILWRQRRIPLYEARTANVRMQVANMNWEREVRKLPPNVTEEQLQQILYCTCTEAILLLVPEGDQLIRYEAHLGRQLTRLFREYHHLQKTRNCETNSPSPPKTPTSVIPSPREHPVSPHKAPDPAGRNTQNCETKAHALRAPGSHENEDEVPVSESPSRVLSTATPERGARSVVVPLERGAARRRIAAPVHATKVSKRPAVTRAEHPVRQPTTEPLARPLLPGVKGQLGAKLAEGRSEPTRAGVDPRTNITDVNKNTGSLNQTYFHDNSPPPPEAPASQPAFSFRDFRASGALRTGQSTPDSRICETNSPAKVEDSPLSHPDQDASTSKFPKPKLITTSRTQPTIRKEADLPRIYSWHQPSPGRALQPGSLPLFSGLLFDQYHSCSQPQSHTG